MRLLTGLRAWTVQRATAVFMLGFVLWLASALLVSPPDSYEHWRAMVAQPAVTTGFSVFFAALLVHAWVGVRDVILDYVHPLGARAVALALVAAALFTIGAWLALALTALHVS